MDFNHYNFVNTTTFDQQVTTQTITPENNNIEEELEDHFENKNNLRNEDPDSKEDYMNIEHQVKTDNESEYVESAQKTPTIINKMESIKNYCEICYSTPSENFLGIGLDNFFKLIHCMGCGTSSHFVCYGIETLTEDITSQNKEIITTFLCDKCREKTSSSDLSCYVCGLDEGCLRITTDGKWIHPLCGIASQNIRYEDISTMKMDLSSFRKETSKLKSYRKCDICKTKVETLKCKNKDLQKYCHLRCALKSSRFGKQKKEWEVFFETKTNPKFSINVEENLLIGNIEDMALDLKEVLKQSKDNGKDSIIKTLKCKKGVRGKLGKRRVEREDPSVVEFFNAILNETKSNTKDLLKDVLLEETDQIEGNDEGFRHMGGEIFLIYLENEDYQNENRHKTSTKMEIEDEMVEKRIIKDILTDLCKEIFEEESVGTTRNLPDFPELERASFPEILVLANIFKKSRVEVILGSFCSFQDLKNLIKDAKKLPFPLTGLMKRVYERIEASIATDILLRDNIIACQPKSLYNELKGEFEEDALKKNSQLIQMVNFLQKFYLRENTQVQTRGCEMIFKIETQLNFLEELYYHFSSQIENVKNQETPNKSLISLTLKLSPSLLKELYEKAVNLGLDNSLPEVKVLELGAMGSLTRVIIPTSSPEKLKEPEQNVISTPKSSKKSVFKIIREPLDSNNQLPRYQGGYSSAKPSLGKMSMSNSISKSKSCGKSHLKMSLSKRGPGRPPKIENLLIEIEKDYEEQLQAIDDKVDLSVIEENLTLYKSQGALDEDAATGIRVLEEAVEKTFEWKKEYEKALEENKGQLKDIIDDIVALEIRIPEMREAIEYQKIWRIWKTKVIWIGRKIKKKRDDILELNSETTLEELEEIVKEGESIKLIEPEDGDFEELKEKLDKIKEIQIEIRNSEGDLNKIDLEKIERELKSINVIFDEILLLKEYVNKNSKEQGSIEEERNPENLQQKFEDAHEIIEDDISELKFETHNEKEELQETTLSGKLSPNSSTTKPLETMICLIENVQDIVEEKEEENHKDFEEDYMNEEIAVEEDSGETWRKEAKTLLGNNPEDTLYKLLEKTSTAYYDITELSTELESYKRRCSRLSNAYAQGVENENDLEEENNQLQMMIQWTSWVIQALSMKQQVEDDKDPLSFRELKLAVEKMREIKLREDVGLCKHIRTWYEKAEKVKKEFRRGYEQVRGRLKMSNLSKESSRKTSEQIKLSVAEASRILTLLRSVADFVRFSDEIELVNEDLKEFEAWTVRVQELCDKYEDILDPKENCERELNLNKEVIEREIELLKKDMNDLVIENKVNELELKVFEWTFQTMLVQKKITKERSYDIIKQLIDQGEQLQLEGSNNSNIAPLVWSLKTELGSTEKTKSLVQNIKKIKEGTETKKVPYESLLSAVVETKDKKDILSEEAMILEELCFKYEEIRRNVKEILGSIPSRRPISEFTRVLDQMKAFPIDMKEERQLIEEAINKANKIISEIKRNIVPDYQQMESLVGKYKKCPIYIKKADEIEKTFEEVKQSYEKVISEGKKILQGESKLTFNELHDLSLKIDKIQEYKTDESLKIIKKDFLVKEVEILQKQASRPRESPTEILSYRSLKDLVLEVSNFKNEFRKSSQLLQWEEIREFLERQTKIAEDVVREIMMIRDIASLERYPSIKGFVDFSQEITEKRASLSAITNVPIQNIPLKYVDILSNKEETGREKETVKKKRGRPPKGSEGSSQKERDNSRASRDEDREREKNGISLSRPKLSQESTRNSSNILKEYSLSQGIKAKETDRKDLSKIRDIPSRPPVVGSSKADTKPSSNTVTTKKSDPYSKENVALLTLRKILESSKLPGLGHTQCYAYAKVVIVTFPELQTYSSSLSRISEILRNILHYKHIGQSLVEKGFEPAYLRKLMAKSEGDLKILENELKLKAQKEMEIEEPEIAQNKSIKRKLKTNNKTEDELRHLLPKPTEKKEETSVWSLLKFGDESKKPVEKSFSSLNGLFKKETISKDNKLLAAREDSLVSETFSQDDGPRDFDLPLTNNRTIYTGRKTPPKTLRSMSDANLKPILYDPDNPTYENSNTNGTDPYDPDMPREIHDSRNNFDKKQEREIIDLNNIPEGSILKIFEGTLICGNDKICSKAGLFTCNQLDLVTNIPEILQDDHTTLRMLGRISVNRFQAYINKALNGWEGKGEKIISGWVESFISMYQHICDHIATDLSKEGKVGVIEYHESSKIFFLHKNDFPVEWNSPLGLNVKKTQGNSNPSLYFIVYHKPAKLTKNVRSISPELIPVFDNRDANISYDLKNFAVEEDKDDFIENSLSWSQGSIDSIEMFSSNIETDIEFLHKNPFASKNHNEVNTQKKIEDNLNAQTEDVSLNKKRPFEEIKEINTPQKKVVALDPRLERSQGKTPEDPRKKLKIGKYEQLSNSDKKENLLNYPEEELLQKLSKMSNEQVAHFARDLDESTRTYIITKLQTMEGEKNSIEKSCEIFDKITTIENIQFESPKFGQGVYPVKNEGSLIGKEEVFTNKPEKMQEEVLPIREENQGTFFRRPNERLIRPNQNSQTHPFKQDQGSHQQRNPFLTKYIPPDYIQKFYQLYTPEELETASQKINLSTNKFPEPRFTKRVQPISLSQSENSSVSKLKPADFGLNNIPASVKGSVSSQSSLTSNDFERIKQPFNWNRNQTPTLISPKPSSLEKHFINEESTREDTLMNIEAPIENNSLKKEVNETLIGLEKRPSTPHTPRITTNTLENKIENEQVFESPIFGKNRLEEDDKKTQEKQTTPDWPRAVSKINEESPFAAKGNLSIPVNQNQKKNEDPTSFISFTMENSNDSFNNDARVPPLEDKADNLESILKDALNPEGKSTVDTQANKMSGENSTNKEYPNSFIFQSLPTSFLSNMSKDNMASKPTNQFVPFNNLNVNSKDSQLNKENNIRKETLWRENSSSNFINSDKIKEEPQQRQNDRMIEEEIKSSPFNKQKFTPQPTFSNSVESSVNTNNNSNPTNKVQNNSVSSASLQKTTLKQTFSMSQPTNPVTTPVTNATTKASVALGKGVQITKDSITLPKALLESLNLANLTNVNKAPVLTNLNPNIAAKLITQLQTPKETQSNQQTPKDPKPNLLQQLQQAAQAAAINKPQAQAQSQAAPVKKPLLVNLQNLQQISNLIALAKKTQNVPKEN